MKKILSPLQDTVFNQDNPFAGLDIAVFFQRELIYLMQEYGYTKEEYDMFLSWHQPRDLVNKILDPNRFFRIIRDKEGKIIGYFESRKKDKTTEVVQWVLIDKSHRGQGFSKIIWEEFFKYCKLQGRTIILSFAKSQNKASCHMHQGLGFKQSDNNHDDLTFSKIIS